MKDNQANTINYYTGFLYSFEVINHHEPLLITMNKVETMCFGGCDFCPSSNAICLNDCPYDEFDDSVNGGGCMPCPDTCTDGCIDDQQCGACEDNDCMVCWSPTDCYECGVDATACTVSCGDLGNAINNECV